MKHVGKKLLALLLVLSMLSGMSLNNGGLYYIK